MWSFLSLASPLISKNKHVRGDDPAWACLTLRVNRFRSAEADTNSNLVGGTGDLVDEAVGLLRSVLDMFFDGTVVRVLLDQADLCQSGPSRKEHRDALIRTLVRVTEGMSDKIVLQVLAVISITDWRIENQLMGDLQDFKYKKKGNLGIESLTKPRYY